MNSLQRAESRKAIEATDERLRAFREEWDNNPEFRVQYTMAFQQHRRFSPPGTEVDEFGGIPIPPEFLPPGGIDALPKVIRGRPLPPPGLSIDEVRDWELLEIAKHWKAKHGVSRPLIEGMSFKDALRMRELAEAHL